MPDISQYQFFSWGPSPYFRHPAQWVSPATEDQVPHHWMPPTGWTRRDEGVWTHFHPEGHVLPAAGWKLHVSTTPASFADVFQRVAAVCAEHDTPFKALRDHRMHLVMNTKYAPRSAAGKAMTIFPSQSEVDLESIISALEVALDGYEGPGILSDLRLGTAPLSARFGAFRPRWHVRADGDIELTRPGPGGHELTDSRRPGAAAPSDASMPHAVERRLQPSPALPGGYRITGAVHHSNGGGVYAAHAPGGERVLLKEARRHAGLDLDRVDARTRLENEERVLRLAEERLGLRPDLPRVVDAFDVGDHRFLALTEVPGEMLWPWQGRHHPMIHQEDGPEPRAAFRERAEALWSSVAAVVSDLHAAGITHGDLHPGNILVDEEGRVGLIDFENARADDRVAEPANAMGGLGFSPRGTVNGRTMDAYALAALRLWVYLPLNSTWAHQRATVHRIAEDARTAFELPADHLHDAVSTLTSLPGTSEVVDRPVPVEPGRDIETAAWAALRSHVGSLPDSRLVAGDILGIEHAAWSFGYGAAGALWALEQHGDPVEVGLLARFAAGVDSAEPARPGFLRGLAGTLPVLDYAGDPDLVHRVVERITTAAEDVRDPSMAHGLSGIGAMLLRHSSAGPDVLLRLADRVAKSAPSEFGLPGLFTGASGAALFLADCAHVFERPALLEHSQRLLDHDLHRTTTTRTGSTQAVDPGRRTLAYLGSGSAGLLVAMLRLRPESTVDDLIAALGSEYVAGPGLAMGRAGLLLALVDAQRHRPELRDRLEPLIRRHRKRFAWHAVTSTDGIEFPGSHGFRISHDFATGTAGIAHVLSAAQDEAYPLLPVLTDPRSPGRSDPASRTEEVN
ncbi:class III lanthionine synthetase LanKC [Micrococcus luteus]|uniref:class III lanthionine synthetase LanKC n=1 Tax=Micrococcus luteus TaxID=1270 RepID=UPI0015D7C79F|nr:class III lanthionine synthetase LanKC [Micrococcus luteus]